MVAWHRSRRRSASRPPERDAHAPPGLQGHPDVGIRGALLHQILFGQSCRQAGSGRSSRERPRDAETVSGKGSSTNILRFILALNLQNFSVLMHMYYDLKILLPFTKREKSSAFKLIKTGIRTDS